MSRKRELYAESRRLVGLEQEMEPEIHVKRNGLKVLAHVIVSAVAEGASPEDNAREREEEAVLAGTGARAPGRRGGRPPAQITCFIRAGVSEVQ